MSSKDDKNAKDDKGGVITHNIQVSASDKEKALQQTKDVLIGDKAKLEQELATIKEKYGKEVTDLKKELDSATTDLTDVTKQRDDYSQKFTVLAMKRYEGEKSAILESAKGVLSAEKIKEIETQIDSPEKLDKMKWFVTNLIEQLQKGKKADGSSGAPPPPPDRDKKGAGGTGNATLDNANVSDSTDLTKKQFNSPKEMIDYLYDQVARGKTISRQVSDGKGGFRTVEERVGPNLEAEKQLNEIWKRYFKSEQSISSGKRTYVMCTQCKGMYDKNLGTCPLCGISLTVGPESDSAGIKEIK